MTIRDKVEEESPDGRALFIEDLRKCLGVATPGCEAAAPSETSAPIDPTRPSVRVILVGHDLRGDFPNLRAEGMKFDPHLDYFGCIDTYVVIKDACRESFGEGLGKLMQHYGLTKGRVVKPKFLPASKAKFVFFGGHNAGNDAIASLKVAIAQALDPKINSMFSARPENNDDLTGDFLSRPLQGMEKNMILLTVEPLRRTRQADRTRDD